MLFSRFWNVVLAFSLVAAMFLLYLATAVSNRNAERTAAKLLTAASNAVGWYMQDDSRTRAAALIPLALDPAITEGLSKASQAENLSDLKTDLKEKAEKALHVFREAGVQRAKKRRSALVFDALWAIDIHGRVLANDNFAKGTGSAEFEMGGYSLVADAVHGWIRDDAWVFDGQIWRVVGRPVEIEVGGTPVGAIVGGKIVDDHYAQGVSARTGAAVAFYAGRERVASGAPASFDKASLEVTSGDIEKVEGDPDYKEKGRTKARLLREQHGFDVRAIFARMPGEAWDLGVGYVVGHRQATVSDPFEFQRLANDSDKAKVPKLLLLATLLGAFLIGLILTLLEHTMPLWKFRKAVADLADKDSRTDVLKPSTFRGGFKKIAANINDALDKVASAAGVDRGPANLESVLGPLPAEPQMSAFALPKAGGAAPKRPDLPDAEPARKRSLPKAPEPTPAPAAVEEQPEPAAPPAAKPAAKPLPKPAPKVVDDDAETMMIPREELDKAVANKTAPAAPPAPAAKVVPPRRKQPPAEPPQPADDGADEAEPADEETQWRKVYADFIAMKKQFGEPTARLTYEKFRGTLQRNKEALIARHGCTRVKFRVYEKQGRAALKASPVK